MRNVALTAPYGHNGSYATLEGIIRHHLDPVRSLENWDSAQVVLPKAKWLEDIDFVVLEDRLERERLKSYLDIEPIDLSEDEVSELVTFMHALTGKTKHLGKTWATRSSSQWIACRLRDDLNQIQEEIPAFNNPKILVS